MSNVQWAGFLLDRLIAPEFSTLTSFSLPDVPELPNYYGSFFLNNMFRAKVEDKARPFVFAMLRHLTQATKAYRGGSKALAEFGGANLQSNDAVKLYLRALTQFEHAIIHCDLAANLSHAIVCCIDPSTFNNRYTKGDNSPEERLRCLYNALKHFDGTVVEVNLPASTAPVWIVTEGLKSIYKSRNGKTRIMKTLRFSEMADILRDLASNAKYLTEEVYRPAHERRAAKTAGTAEQAE